MPIVSGVPAEHEVPGKEFVKQLLVVAEKEVEEAEDQGRRGRRGERREDDSLTLSYYEPAMATANLEVKEAGQYQLVLNLRAN